jgi:hypothetical protein
MRAESPIRYGGFGGFTGAMSSGAAAAREALRFRG